MIPATYPSRTNAVTGRSEMVISVVPSINGLVRWSDYIPVKFVDGNANIESVTDNNGFMPVVEVNPTSLVSGIDYIPVYIDNDGVDAWAVESGGYIPVGYSGMGVPNAEIPFKLAASHLKALTGGTGTFVRATTATVIDHENVIREVVSGEIRYQGQRRVENMFISSTDLSGWSAVGAVSNDGIVSVDSPTGDPVTEVDFGAGAPSDTFVLSTPAMVGDSVFSAYVRTKTGSTTIRLRTGATASSDITIDTTWQRLSFGAVVAIANVGRGFQQNTGGTAGILYITSVQTQDKTGASDPTVPDSYVSTGVGVGSELFGNSDFENGLTGLDPDETRTTLLTQPSDGVIKIENGDAVFARVSVDMIPTVMGQKYIIEIDRGDVGGGGSTGNVNIGGTQYSTSYATSSSDSKITIIATSTELWVTLHSGVADLGAWAEFNSVSIKHADHGSNVDSVKAFLSTNGNSVTDNVVTEAAGTSLTETRKVLNFVNAEYGTFATPIVSSNFEVEVKCASTADVASMIIIDSDAAGLNRPYLHILNRVFSWDTGIYDSVTIDGVAATSGVTLFPTDGKIHTIVGVGTTTANFGTIGAQYGLIALFRGQILSTKFTDNGTVVTEYVFDSGSTTVQPASDGVNNDCTLTSVVAGDWYDYSQATAKLRLM